MGVEGDGGELILVRLFVGFGCVVGGWFGFRDALWFGGFVCLLLGFGDAFFGLSGELAPV